MWFSRIGDGAHPDIRYSCAEFRFIQERYPIYAILRSNMLFIDDSVDGRRIFPSYIFESTCRTVVDMLRSYNGQLAGYLRKFSSGTRCS